MSVVKKLTYIFTYNVSDLSELRQLSKTLESLTNNLIDIRGVDESDSELDESINSNFELIKTVNDKIIEIKSILN